MGKSTSNVPKIPVQDPGLDSLVLVEKSANYTSLYAGRPCVFAVLASSKGSWYCWRLSITAIQASYIFSLQLAKEIYRSIMFLSQDLL